MNTTEIIQKLIELKESKSTGGDKDHKYSKKQKRRRFLFALWKKHPWK